MENSHPKGISQISKSARSKHSFTRISLSVRVGHLLHANYDILRLRVDNVNYVYNVSFVDNE